MFTSILISENLVKFTSGENWVDLTPYFMILCVGGMVHPLTVFNLNIIKVKGKAALYLKLCLFTKSFVIPAILIGLQFDIIGIVVALVIQKICAGTINAHFSGKLVDYGLLPEFCT